MFYFGVTMLHMLLTLNFEFNIWSIEFYVDEFKPASVDKTKQGLLRKTKENMASVEFHNNQ